MTAQQILDQLRPLGLESYKKVMSAHGVPEPFYGVKIEELKKFQKQIKKDYRLALDLYDTGIYDAMYLAGLIADDKQMTVADLEGWLAKATCMPLVQYTVSWVATESHHALELARKWIDAPDEKTATAGWCTLANYVSMTPDGQLDIPELRAYLKRVEETLHDQPNRVRAVMNSFVICVGAYVVPLADEAMATAHAIGKVEVKLPGACKLPSAPEYIEKARARGSLGKKKKTCKC